MANKNYSDSKLSKYFLEKSKDNVEIPYMTTISKEIGVSNATISRYAKRKGYYNFGEMRAKFNRTLEIGYESFDDKGFSKFLNYEKIIIDSSVSAHLIRDFLVERLSYLPTHVSKNENDEEKFDSNTLLIFVCITGESKKLEKLSKNSNLPILIITTNIINEFCKKNNIFQIELTKYKPTLMNNYELNNTVLNILN